MPAFKERLDVGGLKARADLGQRGRVLAGGKPVIQRREWNVPLDGLPLGPLIPVQVQPHRVGRVRGGLQKGGSPVGIADVPVVVVREDLLAAVLEVRVAVRAAVAPAAPGGRALLRDPDHHHPEAPLALRGLEVLARDLLLDIPLHKAHHRDLVLDNEILDRAHVIAADPPQHHRRRDREPAIEQKPDHLKLGLQPRHVPLKEQPVH